MEESMFMPKRKRFQLSSLSTDVKQRLASCIKQLGGTYLDREIFTKQVTHVVCGKPNRGEKYLGGCVSGRWVLRTEFIEDSFKHGGWLCEEDYEWRSEVLEADSPLVALYDAPKKWRVALKNNEGAFKNWNVIVLVQDNKMQKAYQRLLDAGCATILKKKAPFQDSNLIKDVTHVFVESVFKSEVTCFEASGIPCISPDYIPEYIIQATKEQTMKKFTMKDKNIMNTIKLPIKSVNKRSTRGILSGKENGPNGIVIMETMKDSVGKRGIKRQAASDCDLCIAKRQKTMDLLPHCQSYRTRREINVEKRGNKTLSFPAYAACLVESCVDEGCIFLALDSIFASLSKSQIPSSECLHMIMNQFLLNSHSKQQAMQSYHLLQEIILLHPPSSCQHLYLKALEEQREDMQGNDGNTISSSPWEFVSKVIRCSLEGDSNKEKTNRIQENADLLLKFFDNLFKQDANTTLPHQPPIILRLLWPSNTVSSTSKAAIKEFVTLCYECVKLAVHDHTKLTACHFVLDVLSLSVNLKRVIDTSGIQDCESLAQQLFVAMSKTHSSDATKLFLQGCHSSWLKMRITELILGNFDKRLIPSEYKPLLNRTLSLNKIINTIQSTKESTHVKQNSSKQNGMFSSPRMSLKSDLQSDNESFRPKVKIRKNVKGETPLHVACIHNDVGKVEEILEQNVDVNIADNAGWTALHEACNFGHVDCVKKILEYHEKTNKVNLLASPSEGTTVLHDATVNDHLPVVKLLLEAGGTELLEAKTSTGKTALDLAVTKDMADLLESETNKLSQLDAWPFFHTNLQQPLTVEYDKIMNKNRKKYLVAMKDCEEYIFLVSQLLLGYAKENILNKQGVSNNGNQTRSCQNCTADFECWKNLHQHVDNIEMHVKKLTRAQELSKLCQLYIASMKL